MALCPSKCHEPPDPRGIPARGASCLAAACDTQVAAVRDTLCLRRRYLVYGWATEPNSAGGRRWTQMAIFKI
jgi:hypothetical protein